MLNFILANKPVLVGLHLGFAILAIDGLLWLAGEALANPARRWRMQAAGIVALISFVMSWLIGGYYYVQYYGALVKPTILAGNAPWAHGVAMEAKEHIFLFIVPVVILILLTTWLKRDELNELKLKKPLVILTLTTAAMGLSLGLMGYIISAAARWGI